ncbi:hypothetical protein MmazTMA_21490 [Methanosarcina mazei]|nr:hypothetical protein MmazTMA_21490 [Methanosarcina mazei]
MFTKFRDMKYNPIILQYVSKRYLCDKATDDPNPALATDTSSDAKRENSTKENHFEFFSN